MQAIVFRGKDFNYLHPHGVEIKLKYILGILI